MMNTRLAACFVFVLLFLASSMAQDTKQDIPPLPAGVKNVGDAKKIKAVLAREEQLRKSTKNLDVEMASDLYAEDYLQMVMMKWCCVATKGEQLASLMEHRDRKPPDPLTSVTDEQVVVRVYGDTAIVTGVQTVVGSLGSVRLLFMNVWHQDKGKWRIIGGSRKML